ncbi:MAG: c-type cytochrome, partial [Candidatus Xenobia bacterium]
ALDLVSYRDRFPALVPPAGSSAAVARGFAAYSTYCVACHTLNGEGGQIGPELNYPVNVTQYWRTEYIRKWINQPTSIRANAKMPPLAAGVPNRSRTIDDIIAYLKAMAHRKQFHQGK